jgi:hypothetical protein
MTASPPRASLLALGACVLTVGLAQQEPLDTRTASDVVSAVAATVEREYFDEAVANRVAARLRELGGAHYAGLRTRDELASALTRDLLDITHDRHLAVAPVRPPASSGSAASDETREARARRENFGVRQVAILDGNVGYLNLTSFYRATEAGDAVQSAMRLLGYARALIIDMRENGGGSPETVALLAGYLFDAPGKPLFQIVARNGERQLYATPLPGLDMRNGTRPVYVLTSARTFSAGEGFAFILQEQHRAIVVGERTAGAANPGRAYDAGPDFQVIVPNGQVRVEGSGRNWEGSGVTPDIAAPAADALTRAQELARR